MKELVSVGRRVIPCKGLVLACMLALASSAFAVTWISFPSGTTKEIGLNNDEDASSSNPNQSAAQGYNLCCDDGVTIRLTKKAEGVALYRFFSAIIATNGAAPTVTLDVTGLAGAPLRLHNHFHFKSDATLVVKGTNYVEFGANEQWSTYFPTFNVPHAVKFTDASGAEIAGRIRFVDRVCVYPLASGLDWSIADNAIVAPHNNALGFTGDVTLEKYDLMLCDSSANGYSGAVPRNAMITVPTGRRLYLFPTSINRDFRWDRNGGIVSNSVVLAGGSFGIGTANSDARLEGSLTGTGEVFGSWCASPWNANWCRITGPVSFTGTVDFACGAKYYGNTTSTRDYNVEFGKVQPGTRITSLLYGGVSSKPTNGFRFTRDTAKTDADYAANPVVFESIGGVNNYNTNYVSYFDCGCPATFVCDPVDVFLRGIGTLTLQTVGANSVERHENPVVAPAGTTTIPAGAYWNTYGSAHTVFDTLSANVPATGCVYEVQSDCTLVAGNPKWEVHVGAGKTLGLVPTDSRMAVVADGGTVNVQSTEGGWRHLPVLWLDASAPDTVTNLTVHTGYDKSYPDYSHNDADLLAPGTVYYTNQCPFVTGWYDCRPERRTIKLWSDRYDYLWTASGYSAQHNIMISTHPYRVPGGLNGMDYVSFGAASGNKAYVTHPKLSGGTYTFTSPINEGSRGFFYKQETTAWNGSGDRPLKPEYVFLVFGSQKGGGNNIFGGATHALKRSSSALSAPLTSNATVIGKGRAWVDGRSVRLDQPNVLNGGWQVITLELKKTIEVAALGQGGGMDYAEIIVFEDSITDRQRQDIEIYLAEKWGLADQYDYQAAGRVKNTGKTATVYGTGTVRLDAPATLSGAFAGTIDLNGQSLTLEGAGLPPDDTSIITNDCTGWFDPERMDLMVEGNLGGRTPQKRITRLYDRCGKEDGRFCLAERSRAPWRHVSARRFGPARNWMDFSNTNSVPTTNNDGNLFQFRPMKNGDGLAGMWTNVCRTIILAQDSVHGGGQPFVDGNSVLPAAASMKYKERVGKTASSPIYPSGTDGLLTKGRTYLDGIEVDGTTQGFNGRGEILTVIPTNEYGFLCFDHLYNSEKKSYDQCTSAIHGEILMWNRALDDAERKRVEAYLSWKWLGLVNEGYSALTNATVTGAGTVRAASLAVLPKFAADCAATVDVAADALAFHYAAASVVDAKDLGGATLALPAATAVTVSFAEKPVPGDYQLLSCGAGLSATTFSLSTAGALGSCTVSLAKTDTALVLRVNASGTVIIVR